MKLVIAFVTVIGCRGSSPRAPSPPAPASADMRAVALPGPCVDPMEDALQRWRAQPFTSNADDPQAMKDLPPFDFDGDGVPDRLLASDIANVTFAYVVRGSCGHFVGDIMVRPQAEPNAPRHHGLIDVHEIDSNACEGAPCGCDVGDLWLRFDGTVYGIDEAASHRSRERECP